MRAPQQKIKTGYVVLSVKEIKMRTSQFERNVLICYTTGPTVWPIPGQVPRCYDTVQDE